MHPRSWIWRALRVVVVTAGVLAAGAAAFVYRDRLGFPRDLGSSEYAGLAFWFSILIYALDIPGRVRARSAARMQDAGEPEFERAGGPSRKTDVTSRVRDEAAKRHRALVRTLLADDVADLTVGARLVELDLHRSGTGWRASRGSVLGGDVVMEVTRRVLESEGHGAESATPSRPLHAAVTGAPGSGKTIALLKLAQELARDDPYGPIPIVVPLAGCTASTGAELLDWIAKDLSSYQIKEDVARGLVRGGQIRPLFDGLDESAASLDEQKRCLRAVLDYAGTSGCGVIFAGRWQGLRKSIRAGDTRWQPDHWLVVRLERLPVPEIVRVLSGPASANRRTYWAPVIEALQAEAAAPRDSRSELRRVLGTPLGVMACLRAFPGPARLRPESLVAPGANPSLILWEALVELALDDLDRPRRQWRRRGATVLSRLVRWPSPTPGSGRRQRPLLEFVARDLTRRDERVWTTDALLVPARDEGPAVFRVALLICALAVGAVAVVPSATEVPAPIALLGGLLLGATLYVPSIGLGPAPYFAAVVAALRDGRFADNPVELLGLRLNPELARRTTWFLGYAVILVVAMELSFAPSTYSVTSFAKALIVPAVGCLLWYFRSLAVFGALFWVAGMLILLGLAAEDVAVVALLLALLTPLGLLSDWLDGLSRRRPRLTVPIVVASCFVVYEAAVIYLSTMADQLTPGETTNETPTVTISGIEFFGVATGSAIFLLVVFVAARALTRRAAHAARPNEDVRPHVPTLRARQPNDAIRMHVLTTLVIAAVLAALIRVDHGGWAEAPAAIALLLVVGGARLVVLAVTTGVLSARDGVVVPWAPRLLRRLADRDNRAKLVVDLGHGWTFQHIELQRYLAQPREAAVARAEPE